MEPNLNRQVRVKDKELGCLTALEVEKRRKIIRKRISPVDFPWSFQKLCDRFVHTSREKGEAPLLCRDVLIT